MEYTTLSNGMKMPLLGYGVFQIDGNTTERCVLDALEIGYRLIDTAQAYMNERGVGAAMKKSEVAREEIFLVDKVWVSNYGEGRTYESIKQSLELLGTDYIDLMLVHQPYSNYYGAWRDLERALEEGLVKSIGVSSFDPVRLLDLCTFAKVKPVVNQVETNVFWQQPAEHANMEKLGVKHMAWGPFAEGANGFFHNPVLAEVGGRHGKTIGQVALRYLMDMGIIVIPKSARKDCIAENFDVLDFALTGADREQIAELDTGHSVCYDHTDLAVVGGLLDFIKSTM